MDLTVDLALQQGIAAQQRGKLKDAEYFFHLILQSERLNPDANYYLGVLKLSTEKVAESLPLFKTALKANPRKAHYWFSYIDALIQNEKFESAKQVIEQVKSKGMAAERLTTFEIQLNARKNPPEAETNNLLQQYNTGKYDDAEALALSLTERFPDYVLAWKMLGALLQQSGRVHDSLAPLQKSSHLAPQDPETHYNLGNALYGLNRFIEAKECYTRAIALKPDDTEVYYNLSATLNRLGKLSEAEDSYKQIIALKPNYTEAHYSLGVTLQQQGKLEVAEESYKRAILLKPDYAEAHCNLGCVYRGLGRLNDSEASLRQAVIFKPDLADAFFNLSSIVETIQDAEHWVDKCLLADKNHERAKFTKAALRFYQGDRAYFDILMDSKFKQYAYMRSFVWVFSLPKLPDLYFNRWAFFDSVLKKSIRSRPFYEFGVWRAASFRYLIKFYKKGYGFDTFTGLPEEWDVGGYTETAGSYSSNGDVPKIRGGEFIVGKFEDTLPEFFSATRPMASLINFDADLYSSTICALNFSKPVIDEKTVLVFDEFIINESWENDEFKALNEFCSINKCSYEVIAISFFTKQVAVKLTGIEKQQSKKPSFINKSSES